MSEPALVLGAELTRAIDAAHAQHHGAQPEYTRVVPHILIGCSLGAAVRAVEIERAVLAQTVSQAFIERLVAFAAPPEPILADHLPVDLIGGREANRSSRGVPAH